MSNVRVQLKDKSSNNLVPLTTLDTIYANTSSMTVSIADESLHIKTDYLPSANGTSAGIVYNNDTTHLTITSGGLSINTYTYDLTSATTTANLRKVPVVSAVKNFVSTYTHTANNIPASAVSGFATSATNAASTYVHSSNVIPTSAINGFATSVTNAASSYVNSANVIPISAVTSLTELVAGKQDTIIAGEGIQIIDGTTVAKNPYTRTQHVGNVTTLEVEAGKAYQLDCTAGAHTISLAATVEEGYYGEDSYLELYVAANASYAVFKSPLTLQGSLTTNAVNFCKVEFRDWEYKVIPEFTESVYTVTATSGTASGSLYYGIATSTNSYIVFSDATNNTTLNISGATTSREVNIIGNGADKTILTGAIANPMPTGSIVGLKITGGSTSSVGGGLSFSMNANLNLSLMGLLITGNRSTGNGSGLNITTGNAYTPNILIRGCTISGNTGGNGAGMLISVGRNAGSAIIEDSLIDDNQTIIRGYSSGTYFYIKGCTFSALYAREKAAVNVENLKLTGRSGLTPPTGAAPIHIIAESFIDLTGNTYSVALATTGTISVGAFNGSTWVIGGTATVINKDGVSVTIQGSGTQLSNLGVLS